MHTPDPPELRQRTDAQLACGAGLGSGGRSFFAGPGFGLGGPDNLGAFGLLNDGDGGADTPVGTSLLAPSAFAQRLNSKLGSLKAEQEELYGYALQDDTQEYKDLLDDHFSGLPQRRAGIDGNIAGMDLGGYGSLEPMKPPMPLPPGLPAPQSDAWLKQPLKVGEAPARELKADMMAPNFCVSVGTLGHPHRCKSACPKAASLEGCEAGEACLFCHLCVPERLEEPPAVMPPPPPPVGLSRLATAAIQRRQPPLVPPPPAPQAHGVPPSAKQPPVRSPPAGLPARNGNSSGGSQTPETLRPAPAPSAAAVPEPPPIVFSIGTQGHPHNCGNACKYVRRKGGCRNGASCPECHQCRWRRNPPGAQPAGGNSATNASNNNAPKPGAMLATTKLANMPPMPELPQVASNGNGAPAYPSVGSIGHPNLCGLACKFHWRSTGCKDGYACMRCHFCTWRRPVGMVGAGDLDL